jgi:hypothetical protein
MYRNVTTLALIVALASGCASGAADGHILIAEEPVVDTGTDTDAPTDTGALDTGAATEPPPYDGYPFTAADLDDWGPLQAGNWPNTLTDEACGEKGPTCFDCVHVPTGTYARWYLDENGEWYEAILGSIEFGEDFDYSVGSGLGTDGVYYSVDTMVACLPFYEMYVQ